MTGVSILGPWPGTRVLEAQSTVLGELGDLPSGLTGLPSMVQLPDRGPWAESVPRTAALLPELPIELGTHGWKLADRPGLDLERVAAVLREDLDALAVAAYGYTGPLVLSVRGPWTLSAILYLARGDRVLSDAGAVRDVVAALAEGLSGFLASVRTAVPGAQPVLVVREPLLPDVLNGVLATFSGRGRLPAVDHETATGALAQVVSGATAAGATQVVAHGGARFAVRAFQALAASGAGAVGVAAQAVRGPQWDQVATIVEAGAQMWFGLGHDRGRRLDPHKAAEAIAKPWTAVGLPARGLADTVVHMETSPGTAARDLVLSDVRDVRPALRTAVAVAAELTERAHA